MDDPEHIGGSTVALLRYVRDRRLSEAQLVELLGVERAQSYHGLRELGLLVVENDVVAIDPARLTNDGSCFLWAGRRFSLDGKGIDPPEDA